MALLVTVSTAHAQPGFVWMEGESPSGGGVLPQKVEATGRANLVSEGKWLRVEISGSNVAKELLSANRVLTYEFRVAKSGAHDIWSRIGFETSRSDFEWRIDNGAWTRVAKELPTLDLTELATWTDIGWLKLGRQALGAGSHKLEFRLSASKNEKGETQPINFALDALLVTPDAFHPNGKYKPGEAYRDATDEQATKHVFALPEPKDSGARASVALGGLWEVARHDDNAPGEVAAPIRDFPAQPHWKAIAVPGDKNKLRPDLIFAHRLWYRTRVNVPASQLGRSFQIYFPLNNLNTTVYVNGVYCGFNKNPFAAFSIDVTPGIKAGVNEVWVGIKDAYYGFSANPEKPQKLRASFRYPLEWSNKGYLDLDYPVWNAFQSGILNTPVFSVGGAVYASDVFVKPSVARRELAAEVTLSNTSQSATAGEIQWQAVNIATGAVEKTFDTVPFRLAADEDQVLKIAGRWENPKLWWTDKPHEYLLRTTVNIGGRAIDIAETKFGFREWGISADGIKFTLNGVVWHMWAEVDIIGNGPQGWLADYRRKQQRTSRYVTAGQASSTAHIWHGLENDAALDFFDANGIVIRRNASPLDGEVIGYQFIEEDRDKRAANGGSEIKLDLMRNWRDQCVAQVRGERNHASIQIWSIENEFAYINLINKLGQSERMDQYEQEEIKTSNAVMAVDPTRTVMIDGGGATKFQALPVHGDHYVASINNRYPDLAYEAYPQGGGRGRWVWDMKRPRFIGEDYYANGINPADYALVGGEEAFLGKAQARPAATRFYNILQQGYRWGGHYAAWHFWIGERSATEHYLYNSPRAVLVREYDTTFGSGRQVTRNIGIFNDTQYAEPLTFTWTLRVGGKQIATQTQQHSVAPGTSHKFPVTLSMPKVNGRQSGEWVLTLFANGKEIFRDTKPIAVLDTSANMTESSQRGSTERASASPTRTSASSTAAAGALTLTAQSLLVFDPQGEVTAFLKARRVSFTPVSSLASLPDSGRVLIVGRDAISAQESTSPRLAAYASAGRRVIVLDQKHPLKYQALPIEMELAPTTRSASGQESDSSTGRIAFGEDMNHPVLRNLEQDDFFTWAPDSIVYRNAYVKPGRGAKSLVQADRRLQHTALVEVPIANGLLLLSQLDIGAKLGVNPVAQQLMANLLRYAASYKLEYRRVAVVADDNAQLLRTLDAAGLEYSRTDSPLTALSTHNIKMAIINASPSNLKILADNMSRVEAFFGKGGYLVLHNLTPNGLADYNKIVGYDHMIRAARRERVAFPALKSPLTSGLSTGDIVLLSGERIFGWTSDEYVAGDMFSYVVDYDEVAPFGQSRSPYYENAVNNFVNADAWKLINNFPAPATGSFDIPITLPRPQTIKQFTWVGNTNYNGVTQVGLTFDGKDRVAFSAQPNGEPQTFDVSPPRAGREITVNLLDWQRASRRPNGEVLIGLDNIYLHAARPDGFYDRVKPLLNIGGMMHYPRGAGGIVLVNLLFKESETVPLNAAKKRAILSTVLRNLKAPFGGGKTIIAGANLQYSPIDFGDFKEKLTQYRTERGWFGNDRFTFNLFPTGNQKFGGVPFNIFDFPTSPVPTAIMLGGDNVPNGPPLEVKEIPINRKADALFFLHTARLDRRRNAREVSENKKFEMARYVVHYANGKQEIVPVLAEIDIDDYRIREPKELPGAQLAWTSAYAGTEYSAAAYLKQWNNPRPNVAIKSIDMTYGNDKRGVPVLLAITAASAQ
ncbi:MAG: hypothetical protein KY445_08595 [Armatimonadetes bacterium]|nr:hypothetical protein [Armatimonadota bacterium]